MAVQAGIIGLLKAEPEDVRALVARLEDADWQALLWFAGDEMLTPELAAALDAGGLIGVLPDDVRHHLLQVARLNRSRNLRIQAQLQEALEALSARGIVPVLLKGGAMLADSAAIPARMMRDLDLLFLEPDMAEAVAVLESLGYRAQPQDGPGTAHVVGHWWREGEPAEFDVHRAPLEPPHVLSVARLLAETRPTADGRARLPTPPAAAMLAAVHEAVGHGSYVGAYNRLRPVHDLWRLVRGLDDRDWAVVADLLNAGRLQAPVGGMLRLVSRWFGWRPSPQAARSGFDTLGARIFALRVDAIRSGRMPRGVNGLVRAAVRRTAPYRSARAGT